MRSIKFCCTVDVNALRSLFIAFIYAQTCLDEVAAAAFRHSRFAGCAYWAATLLDCSAKVLSITVRQPALSSERCFTMQAVIFGILGISELQRRNASPVHICCASALKAKLAVDDSVDTETAKASTKPAWRNVLA